jgi:hypothetical protein
MPRKILLIAGLTVFSVVFGYGQSANQPTGTAPSNVLTTPTLSFPSPAPTAGISDAGRAGISSQTNLATPGDAAGSAVGATSTTSNSPTATTENNPANDLGPSVFVGDGYESAASGGSGVAEIASRYKAEKATRGARVISNDDVQRMLNNKRGMAMARNMPPLGPGGLEQSGQPQGAALQAGSTQNAQPVPQDTQGGPSASQQGQNGLVSQAVTPPPASASKNQPAEETGTSADNATMPQINRNQQTNDAQGSRRLPATASFLPLLGLLGLASGGIGLCFRKFRK